MKYETKSTAETILLGKKLAQTLRPGDIVTLRGDLGAGKTTLVKGIAAGLVVEEEIVSPTFTLMNVYDMKTLKDKNIKTLVHIDTYRLKNERELVEIGVEDYLGAPETICVIEWPEKMPTLLQNKKVIDINLSYADNNQRRIVMGNG